MTFCDNCNVHLGTNNRDIVKHLETKHGVHVRLGEDSHLAYCNDCHKYLGKKQHFSNQRQTLEKHLTKKHAIYMHGGCMEEEKNDDN